MKSIYAAVAMICLLAPTIAYGADGVQPETVNIPPSPPSQSSPVESFGNIYTAGAAYTFPSLNSNWYSKSTLGGKYAYDPISGSIGFQFDGNVDYSTNTSSIMWAQGTAHLTKAISQDSKIGAFVGYDKSQTISFGAEGLTTLSNNTWAQAQVAIIDSTQASLIAYGFGGSVHQKLSNNFNLRADSVFNTYPTLGLSAYGADAAIMYTLDSAPASFGLTGGYNVLTASGVGIGEYTLAAKIQYSFGGPSDGVRGKLFRTNVLGLTP